MTPETFPAVSRRQLLKTAACGFGYLALADLCAGAATTGNTQGTRPPHFKPRAKRVIFLFMQGAPSHVDTFDYKPRLQSRRRQIGRRQGQGAQNCCVRPSSSPGTERVVCGCPTFSRTWPNTPTTCACSTACTPT